jgi:hypothetical protein
VTADGTAAPGDLVVTASGAGVQSARLTIPYTVAAAASYALAVSPATVSTTAGGAAAAATVAIARTNFAAAWRSPRRARRPASRCSRRRAGGRRRGRAERAGGGIGGRRRLPDHRHRHCRRPAPRDDDVRRRVAAAAPAGGVVTGVARDAQGRPIANARVAVKMVFNPNVVWTRTGADGRYTVGGLAAGLSHQAWAWHEVEYGGRSYCIALGMPNVADYDAFVPAPGVVRDFRWQLTGRIPDAGNNFFGATLVLALGSDHFYDPVLENGDDVECGSRPPGRWWTGARAPS